MARTRTSDITIQKNGRIRARSRIKQYPPDSRVFDTRKEALEWKTDADSKKLAGVYESRREAEETTLREALEAYRNEIADKKKGKTRVNAVNHVNQLIGDRISQYSLAVLAIKHLREFKLRRLDQENPRRPGEKISTSTVRRDLLKISAVFNWYRDEHGLDSLVNPLTGRRNFMPREADHRERRLLADSDPLKDEESRLLSAARDYSTGEYAFLIRWLLASGVRIGEGLLIRWDGVNFEAKTIVFQMVKTKRLTYRRAPLSPAGVAVLREMRDAMPRQLNGLVFSLKPQSIETAWKRIKKMAGVTGLHMHDLRHEALSRLGDLGMTSSELRLFSGHTNSNTLDKYVHLNEEGVAQRLARLSG